MAAVLTPDTQGLAAYPSPVVPFPRDESNEAVLSTRGGRRVRLPRVLVEPIGTALPASRRFERMNVVAADEARHLFDRTAKPHR